VPARGLRALEAAGQDVPPPVATVALIDTGASQSCILRQHAVALGLVPVASTDTLTAVGTTTDGKGHMKEVYEVCITIEPDVFDNLWVLETDTTWLNVGALIGRDILARAILVYDGPAGTCTLDI
jgi:hypothetical protein